MPMFIQNKKLQLDKCEKLFFLVSLMPLCSNSFILFEIIFSFPFQYIKFGHLVVIFDVIK